MSDAESNTRQKNLFMESLKTNSKKAKRRKTKENTGLEYKNLIYLRGSYFNFDTHTQIEENSFCNSLTIKDIVLMRSLRYNLKKSRKTLMRILDLNLKNLRIRNEHRNQ